MNNKYKYFNEFKSQQHDGWKFIEEKKAVHAYYELREAGVEAERAFKQVECQFVQTAPATWTVSMTVNQYNQHEVKNPAGHVVTTSEDLQTAIQLMLQYSNA